MLDRIKKLRRTIGADSSDILLGTKREIAALAAERRAQQKFGNVSSRVRQMTTKRRADKSKRGTENIAQTSFDKSCTDLTSSATSPRLLHRRLIAPFQGPRSVPKCHQSFQLMILRTIAGSC